MSQPPTPPPRRAMPRPAVRAIALSGLFCGLMSCFMAYFSWRMHFPIFFTALNTLTAVLVFVGSLWMIGQLRR